MCIPVDLIMSSVEHEGEPIQIVYSGSDLTWYLHRPRDNATSKQSYTGSGHAKMALVRGEIEWSTE